MKTLLAILLFVSLGFAQGGETTIIRNNPTTLPTVCKVGDVFMKAGVFYINTGTSAGACVWSAGISNPFTVAVTAPSFISNGSGPWTTLTERAVNITPAAGFDIVDTDSTKHCIEGSHNGDTAACYERETAASTNTGFVWKPSATSGQMTASAITNTQIPNGLSNFNTSNQNTGQLTAATSVYIAGSNLLTPATLLAGYVQGTTWTWRVSGITKDTSGTGALTVLIYSGTAGTTSDAALATQAWGTAQTAVIDVAEVDVTVTITGIVTGTATVYWTISPTHHLAITGFCTTAVGGYSGTATFNTATSSLIFGLGIQSAAGGTMETLHINRVVARAFNLY